MSTDNRLFFGPMDPRASAHGPMGRAPGPKIAANLRGPVAHPSSESAIFGPGARPMGPWALALGSMGPKNRRLFVDMNIWIGIGLVLDWY